MIDVSNQYKRAIKEPSRLLKSLILINNKTYSDSEILSINYDENLFMESEFSIGSAIMSSIEVELENTQDIMDDFLEGNEFEIKIGIETSTDTFEFISLGFFIIEDIDKNTFSIKIYANDRMIRFETDYITDLQFPATIKDITLDIANKAGVKLKTTTFINSDYLVSIKPDLKDITLRKALMYIAELAGGYARISRDGYLEIFNIDVSVESNFNYASENIYTGEIIGEELSSYDYNTVTGDNLITFSNKSFTVSTIDKVIIEIPSTKAELGYGENTYYIVDNLFCQNPDAVIKNIYNVLSTISYVPYDGKLQGNPALQAGDSITIKNNGNLINTLITNRTLSYAGGLTEQYKAVGKSNTEKQSTGKGNVSVEVEKAKTEIKVIAGEIEQKVSKEDFKSYAKQTAEEISTKVTSKDFESYVKQTAEEIASKVTGKDVETLVKQNAESWELSINGKLKGTNYKFDGENFSIGTTEGSDKAYHSATNSRWNHSDGSYTQVSAKGLERYESGTGTTYHYYIKEGTILLNSGESVNISVPPDVLAKQGVIISTEQIVNEYTNKCTYALNTILVTPFFHEDHVQIQAIIKWNNLEKKIVEEGGFIYVHYLIVG